MRTDCIRYAPSFSSSVPPEGTLLQTADNKGQYPYTVETLAAFLGESKPKTGDASKSFYAAFGALELIHGGYLKRTNALSLEISKLGEVVAAVKRQRDAAVKEAERLAREAEVRRQEAIRKAAELKKQQEEAAEVQRKAAAEAERLAAKRAADEADRKKKAEIAAAEADAKRKADAAKKEAAEAKATIKAMADKLAEEAKTMNRDNIRSRGQSIAEETAAKNGRKAAPRGSSATVRCDPEYVKKLIDYVKNAGTSGARRTHGVPSGLLKVANEIVSVGMKTLAKTRHPDHGGSQEDMQMLNLATQWLRQMIEQEKTK